MCRWNFDFVICNGLSPRSRISSFCLSDSERIYLISLQETAANKLWEKIPIPFQPCPAKFSWRACSLWSTVLSPYYCLCTPFFCLSHLAFLKIHYLCPELTRRKPWALSASDVYQEFILLNLWTFLFLSSIQRSLP